MPGALAGIFDAANQNAVQKEAVALMIEKTLSGSFFLFGNCVSLKHNLSKIIKSKIPYTEIMSAAKFFPHIVFPFPKSFA